MSGSPNRGPTKTRHFRARLDAVSCDRRVPLHRSDRDLSPNPSRLRIRITSFRRRSISPGFAARTWILYRGICGLYRTRSLRWFLSRIQSEIKVYDAGFSFLNPADRRSAPSERPASEVIQRAIHWVAETPTPFFVWNHLSEAARARDTAWYSRAIDTVDAALHRLSGFLHCRAKLGGVSMFEPALFYDIIRGSGLKEF